jgi:ketosteroid isomerase-like protein
MFEPKKASHLSLEEKVQLLMDERDIKNVIDRYSRAASRGDLELFKSCYHEDAFLENGPNFDGPLSDFYKKFPDLAREVAEVAQYYQTNVLIEIEGDIAHTETMCFSPKILPQRSYNGDKVMRFSGARYLRRFERRNDEWRISRSWFIRDWGYFLTVPPQTTTIGSFPAPADLKNKPFPSLRNQEDLSYKFKNL